MTERASPARKSRCAAMGRLFVRAILSLCLGFAVSGLALSGAARQLSQRESPWQAGSLSTGRLRFDRTQKGGPCLRGQRLLDNAPCQAVAGPDSGALPFPRYCASLVQTKAGRHANGSPFGGAGEEQGDETERARPLTENHRHCDSIALIKSLPIAAPVALSCRACPLRRLRRHLSQRERLWQSPQSERFRQRLPY